jgi:hypothetical protein
VSAAADRQAVGALMLGGYRRDLLGGQQRRWDRDEAHDRDQWSPVVAEIPLTLPPTC